MLENFRYKQIVKALTAIEDLKNAATDEYAIPLHRNGEVYNFLSHSLRVYSKNLFTMTRLSKNYLIWGQHYPSIKNIGPVDSIFHYISGSLIFPTTNIPHPYTSFYSDKHAYISEGRMQNRGAAFYASTDPTLSAQEKLDEILNDIREACTFINNNEREEEYACLIYYIGILDYLKSHLIVLLHAFTFNERYGAYRLNDEEYQNDRSSLFLYATTCTRMYYQAILGLEFDAYIDLEKLAVDVERISKKIHIAGLDTASIKGPELEHPIVILESASCVCQKYPTIDTVLGIPSGGTEYAVATMLIYERLRGASPVHLILMPISRYSKDRVPHANGYTVDFKEYLRRHRKKLEGKHVLILDDNSNTGLTATLATVAIRSFNPQSTSFQVAEIDIYRTIVKNTDETLKTQTISNPNIFDCVVNMVPITYHEEELKDFKQIRKLFKLEVLRAYYMGLLPTLSAKEKPSFDHGTTTVPVKICTVHNEYDLRTATCNGVKWLGIHLTYHPEQYIHKLLDNGDKAGYLTTYIRDEYYQGNDMPIPWAEYGSIRSMLKNVAHQRDLHFVFLFTTDNTSIICDCLKQLLPETYAFHVHIQIQAAYKTSFVKSLARTLKKNSIAQNGSIQTINMNSESACTDIEMANADPLIEYILLDSAQHGGTGKATQTERVIGLAKLCKKAFFIAGGLNPDNIRTITHDLDNAQIYPFGFDIETGVERDDSQILRTTGNEYVKMRKDPIKVNNFCDTLVQSRAGVI